MPVGSVAIRRKDRFPTSLRSGQNDCTGKIIAGSIESLAIILVPGYICSDFAIRVGPFCLVHRDEVNHDVNTIRSENRRSLLLFFGSIALGICLLALTLWLFAAWLRPYAEQYHAEHFLYLQMGRGRYKRWATHSCGLMPSVLPEGAELFSRERDETTLNYSAESSATFYWDAVMTFADEEDFRKELTRLNGASRDDEYYAVLRDGLETCYVYMPYGENAIRYFYEDSYIEAWYWIEVVFVDEERQIIEYFCSEVFASDPDNEAIARLFDRLLPLLEADEGVTWYP